ncbi:movement protein [Trichinella pseudospiralis]
MECGNKMSQRGQDQDALLRMGGRLRRSTLPPEPNIQSSYHTITRQDRTRQGTDKILDHQRQKRGEEDNLFIAVIPVWTLLVHCLSARKYRDAIPE